MSESEQVQWFVTEMQKVINRAAAEFSMTLATVIGAIEIVKLDTLKHHGDKSQE